MAEKKGIDRRSFLLGAAGGAAATALGAAGVAAVREKSRRLRTPAAVDAGKPAEIAESFADSRPAYAADATAPAGAPNVVVIILDDVGFADLGCYGSEIRTPSLDALAAGGLRYTNFRTCAMCSPTRAALMTGLNHHSAGMGWLADVDAGYPGYRGDLTHDAATLAEVLRERGWSTLHVGKWHVNLAASCGPTGPYHNWPTSRGFERAYWFQGHSTDYFKPSELIDGVTPVEAEERDDYFVNDALTDRAIAYVQTQKAVTPEKPFYLQLCYPAAHSPLQARPRDRDAYRGAYDAGWDVVRARRLERQRALGVVPGTTQLPPLSPGADPWDRLDATQQRVCARYMEVYAGCISNADANIGRFLAALDAGGWRENTLVLVFSDNGGSAEGTPTGTPNVFAPAFGRPVPVEEAAKLYDVMGEDATFPHYPIGWACCSNTPYRLYKQYAHLGGVADPLIVSWPKRIAAKGELRTRFVHVVDLYPTILEATGVERPATHRGRRLKPVEGTSVLATFADPAAPTRTSQYFELGGQRAFLDGDWRLATRHARGTRFEDDVWELYDLAADPNELVDLAAEHPDKVRELVAKWNAAAERYGVFPLDDRNLVIKMVQDRQRRGLRADWELVPPLERLASQVAPLVCALGHEITVELERPAGRGDGVLLAHGSRHAGYVLHVRDGRLVYEQSLAPWNERIESDVALPDGPVTVRYVQTMTARPFDGTGALYVGDRKVAEHAFARVLFSTSYDGFSLGSDLGNRVSTLYAGPNPFQGRIVRVKIHVDTTPFSAIETMRFIDAIGIRV
ncbi:MAG: arylsulfatase [Deltaproteobacteria bacterium]|nr:arylsulfatase [Deltaproteobacteria bacterium]